MNPKVFFYELAHAAHHRIAGKFKDGQLPSHEIVAELTAATLGNPYCPDANLGFSHEDVKTPRNPKRASSGPALINTVGKVLVRISYRQGRLVLRSEGWKLAM